jgi:tetratricopeptide (TPR) repeat protein
MVYEYENIETAIDSAFRLGDLYFSKGDLKKSVSKYRFAVDNWPGQIANYPNAVFNLAEALFWQKEYKASLDYLNKFIEIHPNDKHASLAIVRAGEILEILGAPRGKTKGAYLEAKFRYPNTLGAELAEARLASLAIPRVPEKDVRHHMSKLTKIIKDHSKEDLGAFATLIKGEALFNRGEYQSAFDLWRNYIFRFPTTKFISKLKLKLTETTAKLIEVAVRNKNWLEAITIHKRYGGKYLDNTNRTDYLLNLATSYYELGLHTDVADVMKTYNRVHSRMPASEKVTNNSGLSMLKTQALSKLKAGRYDEASRIARKLLNSEFRAFGHFVTGSSLFHKKDYKESAKHLNSAFGFAKEKEFQSQILLKLSRSLASAKNYKAATKSLDTLICIQTKEF